MDVPAGTRHQQAEAPGVPSCTLRRMPDGESEDVVVDAAGGPAVAELDARPGGAWERLEIVAAVIVAAQAVRVAGAVVSGLVYGFSTHTGPQLSSQQLAGTTLQTIAGFADGPGLVLLLISLGLVWWRTSHWCERLDRSLAARAADGGVPDETVQLRRLDRLATAVGWLLAVVAAGAVLFFVGLVLLNTVHGESSASRVEAFANGAFPLAYAVIAVAGAAAARHLSDEGRAALART
jgi:hypothetical protein